MTPDSLASPGFTVLLPIHRPPTMLPSAIRSVLGQSRQDFELFVICDGAPPESAACARDFAAEDARIRVFVHSKGERNGELYRDQALRSARGVHVCQIADDDLWFPNHLEEMARLLERAEFGNVLQVSVGIDGGMSCQLGDLARTDVRRAMLERRVNFFGPTVAGYRLSTYRRLPVGWSPAPPGLWSDLHMWRKFLALPGIACATRFSVTALHMGASERSGMSEQERAEENRRLFDEIQDPARRDEIVQTVMGGVMLRAQLAHKALSHLARAGGSAALEQDLRQSDGALLAELQRAGDELAQDRERRRVAKRHARNARTMRRWLRWITGAT